MKELLSNPVIKPISLVTVVPNMVIAPVVDFKAVVEILVWLFIADLISGLLGSYFEFKSKYGKEISFFRHKEGFSSDKFKKCFLKGIIYGGFPLVVLKFQHAFLFKNITFSSVTDSQIDITTVCLLVFCANEIFSIFWENLPKCGLDIPKGIRNLITGVKDINNEVRE